MYYSIFRIKHTRITLLRSHVSGLMERRAPLGARIALRAIIACVAIIVASVMMPAKAASLSFEGLDAGRAAIKCDVAASTGLECVYVISSTGTAAAVYDAGSFSVVSGVRWQKFSNLGGGFAVDVPSTVQGTTSKIQLGADDAGYIVESDGRRYCFWIVNYRNHLLNLQQLDIAPNQTECDRTELYFAGDADKITYYSINGVGQTLSRELHLTYNTLTYNEEKDAFYPIVADEMLESASDVVRVPSPLCDTDFTLTGDRFLAQWDGRQSVSTSTYRTISIGVHASARQEARDVLNEQKDQKANLGGSGPVEITFTAATTDAVVYREWQFSRARDFDYIDLRIQEDVVEHTFSDYGNTYVRFIAANNDNTCTFTSETFDVYIGESKLECPNAFSPGASEGVNDEWRVSYKSIVDFDCHIFNRWGAEVAHLTHPSQGWDGYYNGKLVPPGVYYYVIKASGTDGQQYKLSGDINILRYTSRRDKR